MFRSGFVLALGVGLLGCASEADDGDDCRTAVNACAADFECVQRSGAWTCRPEGEVLTVSGAGTANTMTVSDPNMVSVVYPPEAALTTTISQTPDGSCSSTRGPLSIGEYSTELLAGSPGTGRLVNGTGGSVACTVASTGTGFAINASINASTLEKDSSGVSYGQEFLLNAMYPALTTHAAGATASISSTDSNTQANRSDGACALDVISFGSDGTGGALFATFNCSNFADANIPDTACRLTGTIVLENCDK